MRADVRPTELQCQATIVDAARRFGWIVHAERTSLTQSGRYATAVQGDRGWVDLVLVREARALFIELKRRPNTIEPAQQRWHEALHGAGLDVRVVWVPEGVAALISELAGQS